MQSQKNDKAALKKYSDMTFRAYPMTWIPLTCELASSFIFRPCPYGMVLEVVFPIASLDYHFEALNRVLVDIWILELSAM